MKELLEVIAKRLVEHPEQVVVTETNNERALVLELKVAPEDMGKVIGKQGKIALYGERTILKSWFLIALLCLILNRRKTNGHSKKIYA